MRSMVRPTEVRPSSPSGQSRWVQILGGLPRIPLFLLFFFVLFPIWGQRISKEVEDWVVQYGERKGIPSGIVIRLMLEESGGVPTAISPLTSEGYCSRGLFQIYDRPSNIQWLLWKYWKSKKVFNVYDPKDNAIVALSYLADLYKQFGSWYLALCYYNHGSIKSIPYTVSQYANRIIGGEYR